MRISYSQLKKYSVETVSGKKLGHVVDMILEIEGQSIAQYVVKSSMLSNTKFLVNRTQVVRFEADKLIVDDNIMTEEGPLKKTTSRPATDPEPVSMSSTKV